MNRRVKALLFVPVLAAIGFAICQTMTWALDRLPIEYLLTR